MTSPENTRPGQALVGVLLIFLLVAALTMASLTLAASHRQNTARQREAVQAYYAAEAGVERTLLRIKKDPGWFAGWLSQLSLNQESSFLTYITPDFMPPLRAPLEQVTIKQIAALPAAQIEIKSTGLSRPGAAAARKTLLVQARLYHPAGLLSGCSILSKHPLDITLGNSFSLTGSSGQKPVFYVNGSLTRRGGGHSQAIFAEIFAAGAISGNYGSSTLHPDFTGIPSFPALDENWYRENAQHIVNGDAVFGIISQNRGHGNNPHEEPDITPPYSGIYFVDGDVEISGTYTGQAVIFATGKITVTRDLEARDSNSLLILIARHGPVDIKNNRADAFIIAPEGIDCQGNATINGGLLAGSFEEKVNGNLTINCNPALVSQNLDFFLNSAFSPTVLEMKVDSWREQYDIF
ncbi:MAG: hypothetical protein ACUVTU_09635 [Desulfurispora sp.]|uniref:hypothetical protein n=1 Tax=Desulfurispora sp. TaxID=3014275 RepID=UPI0040493EE1